MRDHGKYDSYADGGLPNHPAPAQQTGEGRVSNTQPNTPASRNEEAVAAIRELLGHLSDVLPEKVFDKIDTAKWNAVSRLAAPGAAIDEGGTNATVIYGALSDQARKRTSRENVEDVLAALASRPEAPSASASPATVAQPALMQDESSGRDGRRYNEWHASRPDARLNAREAAAPAAPPPGWSNSKMNPWLPDDNPRQARRLGKTGEEVSELASVLFRISIQGLEAVDPSSGKTNRLRLLEETADVMAQNHCNVRDLFTAEEGAFIRERARVKVAQMGEWESHYGTPPGSP